MRVYIYLSQKAPEIIIGLGKDIFFFIKGYMIQLDDSLFCVFSIVSRLKTAGCKIIHRETSKADSVNLRQIFSSTHACVFM